jgi:alpha-beta hydrolase superfamily lysophospholipase
MVNTTDFYFPSSDGTNSVHTRLWQPDTSPVAVVQLVHGVAEHIGRYDAFARFLAEHGYVVAGDDHLGHGLTAQNEQALGWFGDSDGWTHLVQDEKALRDRLHEQFPSLPLVLLGHSMGSFISRTYLGWYPQDFDGCILSGTGHHPQIVCQTGKRLAQWEIARHGSQCRSKTLQKVAFGGYLKGIENPIGENDWICRDEAVIHAYDADPLCGFTATAGLMRDMMEGLGIIGKKSHMTKMKKSMPVLFIAGQADPVGAWGKGVETVVTLFRQAGMQDVACTLYPEARHEVLNELNKTQVWADVLSWLEEKI